MAYRPNAGPDHQPPASKRKRTANLTRPAAGPGGAQAYGKAFWTGGSVTVTGTGPTDGGDRNWCYSHPTTAFGQTANSYYDTVNFNAYDGGHGYASSAAYIQCPVGALNTTWISQPCDTLAAHAGIATQSLGSESIPAHGLTTYPLTGESWQSSAAPLFLDGFWQPELQAGTKPEPHVLNGGTYLTQVSGSSDAGVFHQSWPSPPQAEFTYTAPLGGAQEVPQASHLPSPPDSNPPYPDVKSPSYYLDDFEWETGTPSDKSPNGSPANQPSPQTTEFGPPPPTESSWVHVDEPYFDGITPPDWVPGCCFTDAATAQQFDGTKIGEASYAQAPEILEDDCYSDSDRKRKKPVPRIKACLRCRFQKQKCTADPDDPNGDCMPCKTFSRTSKKTIHRSPCFRKKITDVVLFRSGGLDLTRRWTGTQMRNVASRDLTNGARTIEFTQSPHQVPIMVKVAAFQPIIGDVTSRYWTVVENGRVIQKSKEIMPFCLANIHEAAAYFEKYVIDNAIQDFIRRGAPASSNETTGSTDIIHKTYTMAVQHYFSLEDHVQGDEGTLTANREKRLLGNLFILWFAIRQTTGSAYICSEDKLDMAPEVTDPSYPLRGRVSLPRMLLAQFDSINHTKLLAPYRLKVLRDLEWLIKRNKKRYWFTLYLVLFILLREASWITEDRARHAKAVHQAKIRYSIPHFVESLQEGCNMLLMFWHYYNCRPMPSPERPQDKQQSFLSDLTPEQYQLIMETMASEDVQNRLCMWGTYATENGALPSRDKPNDYETKYTGSQSRIPWDHPYYWVAQLFEEKWGPHPTYQREHVPRKSETK